MKPVYLSARIVKAQLHIGFSIMLLFLLLTAIASSAQSPYKPYANRQSGQQRTTLPDADQDGIADQLDKCPNTPAGISVNSHGCPSDRDGDGVPDYLDKQPMTSTECQPVDADGVGKCPCNNCKDPTGCSNITGGQVYFSNRTFRMDNASLAKLSALASQMQANGGCKVAIIGTKGGSSIGQQQNMHRVQAVIKYLIETGHIDKSRLIANYDGEAPPMVIIYRVAIEGTPGVPCTPPYPDLYRK